MDVWLAVWGEAKTRACQIWKSAGWKCDQFLLPAFFRNKGKSTHVLLKGSAKMTAQVIDTVTLALHRQLKFQVGNSGDLHSDAKQKEKVRNDDAENLPSGLYYWHITLYILYIIYTIHIYYMYSLSVFTYIQIHTAHVDLLFCKKCVCVCVYWEWGVGVDVCGNPGRSCIVVRVIYPGQNKENSRKRRTCSAFQICF